MELRRTGLARVQIGESLLRSPAGGRVCGRRRFRRDADRLRRALGQIRPNARRICGIRRGAGQLAASRPLPSAARRAASLGGRAYRPAFGARYDIARRGVGSEGGDGKVRDCRHDPVLRRARGKGMRLEAGARRKGVLRRGRRFHLLSPAFFQHCDLGRAVRFLLERRLYLRNRRAGEVDRQEPPADHAHFACSGPVPGSDRRPLPDVHDDEIHERSDVPAHRHLDLERVRAGRRRRNLRQFAAALPARSNMPGARRA